MNLSAFEVIVICEKLWFRDSFFSRQYLSESLFIHPTSILLCRCCLIIVFFGNWLIKFLSLAIYFVQITGERLDIMWPSHLFKWRNKLYIHLFLLLSLNFIPEVHSPVAKWKNATVNSRFDLSDIVYIVIFLHRFSRYKFVCVFLFTCCLLLTCEIKSDPSNIVYVHAYAILTRLNRNIIQLLKYWTELLDIWQSNVHRKRLPGTTNIPWCLTRAVYRICPIQTQSNYHILPVLTRGLRYATP